MVIKSKWKPYEILTPKEYFSRNFGTEFREAKNNLLARSNKYTFSFDMDEYLQDMQRKKSDFLKEVDQAIKDYFMFKYNTDLNEIERIKNNVNNFKLNSRFQKVVSLSSGQDNYYDGELLFLTVVNHPLKENLIIRHGW